MFENKLRAALSTSLETGGISAAQELLYKTAESYVERSEEVGDDSDFFSIYESRANRALFLAYLLPQLVAMEQKIAAERKEIKKLDGQLVSAMMDLRKYLGECLALAEAVIDRNQVEQDSIWWAAAPAPFYVSRRNSAGPIAYLSSFSRPPGTPYCMACMGRPNTHKTIESEGYREWPFMPLVYSHQAQQYLASCFQAVALAQHNTMYTRGRGRSALKAFEAVKGAKQELLRMDVVDKILDQIRELEKRRWEVSMKVEREILMIDRYYDDLQPCEETWCWSHIPLPSLDYSPFEVDISGNPVHCQTLEMNRVFLQSLVRKKPDVLAVGWSINRNREFAY